MDQLRRLIEACQAHYEKIILSVALLALGLAVVALQSIRQREEAKLDAYKVRLQRSAVKGVPPLDLARFTRVTNLLAHPPAVALKPPHHLFNPVRWQRAPDGTLIKIETGSEVGWPRMVIKDVRPLKFVVELVRVALPGYWIALADEASPERFARLKRYNQVFATLDATNKPRYLNVRVALRAVNGPPDNPQSLVLQLVEQDKQITVAPDKPYEEVVGYEADLLYPPTGLEFKGLRVGSKIHFLGDDYNILAISEKEVVASSLRNGRKYTVSTRLAPQGQK